MRHLSILQGLGTMLDTVWQREESEVKREIEGREEERGLWNCSHAQPAAPVSWEDVQHLGT